MELPNHDVWDAHGFNVDPHLLAHDLTMLKLSKMEGIEKLPNNLLYDTYTSVLEKIENEIATRIQGDAGLSK